MGSGDEEDEDGGDDTDNTKNFHVAIYKSAQFKRVHMYQTKLTDSFEPCSPL